MSETQRAFDGKTKPRGSLGVLEELAVLFLRFLREVLEPRRDERAHLHEHGRLELLQHELGDPRFGGAREQAIRSDCARPRWAFLERFRSTESHRRPRTCDS